MKKNIRADAVPALRYTWRLVAIAATMSVACSAHAQIAAPGNSENSVTVYGAYRWGGSVTDENTDASVSVVNDASYALAVDIGIDRQTQVQLFYSRQKSVLEVDSSAATSTLNNQGLTIDYYHLGGNVYFKEVGTGPYIVGGIGATHVNPDRGDLNSETFLSGNLGLGFMLPLGKHVGLRFEARGYATLIDSDSAVFCGNVGCITAIESDGFYQGEALAGVSIRF